MRKQNSRTSPYTQPTKITLDTQCNCVAFKNAGNSILLLNNDPLQPGETKAFGAWPGEVVVGKYYIDFKTPAVVPVGYVQDDFAIVTEQFYLPEQKI